MVFRKGDPCPITENGQACGKPVLACEMCSMHYARYRAYGDPLHPVRRYVAQSEKCTYEGDGGCDRKPKRRGLCEKHAKREVKYGETTEPRERKFWAKVNKNGPVPDCRPELGPCWIWTGYIDPKTGYGQFGSKGKGTNLPHRIAYQYLVGPIGKGLHLDHLCRVRACVRPAHLEPVTPQENIRRGDQGAFWGYVPDPIPVKPVQLALDVPVCGHAKPVYKRNLCRPCYRRWLKDPNVERPSQRTPEQRFWEKADKNGPLPEERPELGPCWVWTAMISRHTGYGRFSVRHGESWDAHRYSYLLEHGSIPEKHDVHHACLRRSCVRPSHLLATTRSENLRLRKKRRAD